MPVKRLATLLGAIVPLLVSAPVGAIEPSPQIFTFQQHPEAGATFSTNCLPLRATSGGFDDGLYLTTTCQDPEFIMVPMVSAALDSPQAQVKIWVRERGPRPPETRSEVTLYACASSRCSPEIITQQSRELTQNEWVPFRLEAPDRVASIRYLAVSGSRETLDIDDVGLAVSVDQPDTEITAGPPAQTTARDATFAYSGNQSLVSFACTLDGAPLVSCPQPTLANLSLGPHTFAVAAVDRWKDIDATPASHTWTIRPAPPADADGDGVPDARDNCPSTPNADQADVDADGIGDACESSLQALPTDADRDGVVDGSDNCRTTPNGNQADADADAIGDACEVLAAGNVPPVAGVNTVVRLISGDVFVKLPRTTVFDRSVALREPLQEPGFLPLKGIASVPVGATVDARAGRLAVTSAANTRRADDLRHRIQTATFAAGIFRIRQARRAAAAARRRLPTDIVLVSAAGAEAKCAGSMRRLPLKGIVRSVSATGKGFYRAVGGASIGKTHDATWLTADRCDGTLTQVGRGSVTVRDLARKRKVRVRAGQSYLARKPLFVLTKGQPRTGDRADANQAG